ncbi:MAG: hypothetical protein D6713_09055, partial [Deltaproteobacteria bacterium]
MTERNLLFAAPHLVASGRRLFSPGGLLVSGGRVLFAGELARAELFAPAGTRKVDLPDSLVIPGLVNAHTHLCIPPLGEEGREDFSGWILKVMGWRIGVSDEDLVRETSEALRQCAVGGVSLVGDISYAVPGQYAASRIRVRAFFEVIGLSRDRWEETAEKAEKMAESLPVDDPFVRPGLSPHSFYTTTRECFKRAVAFAQGKGFPLQVHFSESADEVEFLRTGGGPLKERIYEPLGLSLDEFSPLGEDMVGEVAEVLPPGAILVHGTFLTAEDVSRLREKGFSLVLCPRSNRFLSGRYPPVTEVVDSGILFGVGTDSRASCGELDMFEEMRALADAYHGSYGMAEFCSRLFSAVTESGALLLGFHDVTG